MTDNDPAVEAAAMALMPFYIDSPLDEVARAAVAATRPIIEAEVRERCGPDHVLGQPCHHLYSRCFPTDASLREYRERQREHGARKERERIAAHPEECDDPWTCCIGAHRDFAARITRGEV